jgi:probable rRNA maturation factor
MSSSDGSLVSYRRVPAGIRPRALERTARTLRDLVAAGREFHCLISGDAELRRLNRDFLGHDFATDVLSFPSGERSRLGDLAISIQRARAQARRFGHDVEQEIGVLMLHGVLHLLGMDHETDGGRMARAEARWRRQLGLPGGLIERAGDRV